MEQEIDRKAESELVYVLVDFLKCTNRFILPVSMVFEKRLESDKVLAPLVTAINEALFCLKNQSDFTTRNFEKYSQFNGIQDIYDFPNEFDKICTDFVNSVQKLSRLMNELKKRDVIAGDDSSICELFDHLEVYPSNNPFSKKETYPFKFTRLIFQITEYLLNASNREDVVKYGELYAVYPKDIRLNCEAIHSIIESAPEVKQV